MTKTINIRPYQLMCIVCKIGSGLSSDLGNKRLNEILKIVREKPNTPASLRCNVDSNYQYQNPGKEDDSPEGDLFNEKRDLDILQKLGLVPGSTRPVVELFLRLFSKIPTAKGICGYEKPSSKIWKGCAEAESGNYEKGHKRGIGGIISLRREEEKERIKKESVDAMYKAKKLSIQPSHLLCLACFHGGRKKIRPIKEDNLFEIIDIIQKNPDIPVTLVRSAGDDMICPPCSQYDPVNKWCHIRNGGGVRNQKKRLYVLQKLGLEYGVTLPAKVLFKQVFKKIPSTRENCGFGDGVVRGYEWSICSSSDKPEGSPSYRKGRDAGLGFIDIKKA